MRTSHCFLAFVICAVVVSELFATDVANTNRGFSPDGMFQTGDVDNVNLFNGNLIINIPLPARFPLNGGASYGIGVVYTGIPWDYVWLEDGQIGRFLPEPVPNRRSNAGLGWRVTMGRLITPSDASNPCNTHGAGCAANSWVYESPDGADHVFYATMHPVAPFYPGDSSAANIFYTRDNSYLRLKNYGSSLEIEFPDGMIQSFNTDGSLSSIRTKFEVTPSVNVAYVQNTQPANPCGDTAASSCWKITDNFQRLNVVTFQDIDSAHPENGKIVRQIRLAAFNGSQTNYTFTYDGGSSSHITLYTDPPNTCSVQYSGTPPSYVVPILTSITLPDGSQYSASIYNQQASTQCNQGALQSLTLPTRGRLDYTYTAYITALSGRDDDLPYIPGVATKEAFDRSGTSLGKWTYTPLIGPSTAPACQCPSNGEQLDWTVTVQTPDNDVFLNYFSVDRHYSANGWKSWEYGLPVTHGQGLTRTDGNVTRGLSTQTKHCVGQSCTLFRSTYLEHDHDGNTQTAQRSADDNRRVKSSVVVDNDSAQSYALTANSDFDGLGHYRTTTTDGNFDGNNIRTVVTNYNKPDSDVDPAGLPNVGTYDPSTNAMFTMLGTNDRWVLGTFSSQTVTEGSQSTKSLFAFERSTGFLQRRRAITGSRVLVNGTPSADDYWTGSTPGPADTIAVFTHDTAGNLTREEYYGGDAQAVGVSALASLSLPGVAWYRIDHAYQYGALSLSQYFDTRVTSASVPFKSFDADIDANTGNVKTARDTAGASTGYVYDWARRLTTMTPTGSAPTSYAYPAATPSTPALADVQRQAQFYGNIREQVQYDGLGRLVLEQKLLRSGDWTSRSTTYSPAGRKATQSMWESTPADFTVFSGFDPFGRAGQIAAPDNKVISFQYDGFRSMTRVASVGNLTAVRTRETYDRFGRLIKVEEPGVDGSLTTPNSTTTYLYDIGGRLAHSTMTDGTHTQQRSFRYDNRGFLIVESHAENGTVTYGGYDARGHVGNRSYATPSPYDLQYLYDAAERTFEIDSRNPFAPSTFRVSKRFTFGETVGNSALGKLETATRHNYLPNVGDVTVKETYGYADSAGRLTNKWTDITADGISLQKMTQATTYNDLDEPISLTYPTCYLIGCGDTSWTSTTTGFTNGFRSADAGFASNITYSPNQTVNVIQHFNGVNDTYAPDPKNMPRPASISFGSFSGCTAPTIMTPPSNQAKFYNQTATLSVGAAGTQQLLYQWYGPNGKINGETGTTYTTPPLTQTSSYTVQVTNSCGTTSASATVTVTYAPPQNLIATQSDLTHVAITFTASPYADYYQVERRNNGSAFFPVITLVGTTSYTDSVSSSTTYVYRVRAVDQFGGLASAYSNYDLATTMSFTPITVDVTVDAAAHLSEILNGLNSVRVANGWPGIDWPSFLPAGIPAPGNNVPIYAAHITSLRSKMDEALQALGLPTYAYTDPTLNSSIPLKRVHVQDLRDRTQ